MDTVAEESHLLTYPVELTTPIVVHSLHDNTPDRIVPEGTIVTVIENVGTAPRETLYTMVIMLSGVYYARDLLPDKSQYKTL